MLVERDNLGRDALILAGRCLVWDEAPIRNTPPDSSARATLPKQPIWRAWLSTANSELKTRYTNRKGPTTGICAMSSRGRHGQAKQLEAAAYGSAGRAR